MLTLLLDTFKSNVFIGNFSGSSVNPKPEQSTLTAANKCGPPSCSWNFGKFLTHRSCQ